MKLQPAKLVATTYIGAVHFCLCGQHHIKIVCNSYIKVCMAIQHDQKANSQNYKLVLVCKALGKAVKSQELFVLCKFSRYFRDTTPSHQEGKKKGGGKLVYLVKLHQNRVRIIIQAILVAGLDSSAGGGWGGWGGYAQSSHMATIFLFIIYFGIVYYI